MIEKQGIIKNPKGLHCRPATIIAKAMNKNKCDITITKDDGSSVKLHGALSVISLALVCGASFNVQVEGENEEAVCEQLVSMMEDFYEFEE